MGLKSPVGGLTHALFGPGGLGTSTGLTRSTASLHAVLRLGAYDGATARMNHSITVSLSAPSSVAIGGVLKVMAPS
jgi:hypothetical protein